MRPCMCVRRLRHDALVFCRWPCLGYFAVFVAFLVLISQLHRIQLRLEPKHLICRTVEREQTSANIWPRVYEREDRILLQLAYKPKKPMNKTKLIFTEMMPEFEFGTFENDHCSVDQCSFSTDHDDSKKADVIIVKQQYSPYIVTANTSRQITVLFQLESPINMYGRARTVVNWTATYRLDSTIVTPYEKFVYFDNFTKLPQRPSRNYALGKKKLVAWFVSNCMGSNSRLEYARELARHISVDVYGACGSLFCARENKDYCFSLLKKNYKFYLAFENSNCRDYITEKLYWNAYLNDIVPVVMGAPPEDYRKVAPPHSYIHVDDFASPRELAAFLRELDADDALYNDYFRWKGTGHFINTKFWCRVCAMAHAADEQQHAMWYENVNQWIQRKACLGVNRKVERWTSWRNVSRSPSDLKFEYLVRHQVPAKTAVVRCGP